MIKTFTQNDLVQYLYNELPRRQRQLLEDALMVDQGLAEACADLLIAQVNLDDAFAQPSQRVCDAIISYSRTVSLHP
ncbi:MULTISPECIES: hypothetical protein [Rufibacter]|uniref:Uncharacterized protein n=1 Tax=Rufibacter quisquiliarum TaxID=1549639 RepID=A0A839GDJ0_9BACT|nr:MULTISPECIES: hypothetical protein [Rufibacter]MBA9077664.1 hypothetical protein [Rufibacter quisquiliarum]